MSLYLDAVNIARSSAGLAIKEAESPTVTVANETAYTINSTLYSVASGDVSLALASSRDGTWITRTSALTLEDGKHCIISVYADTDKAFFVEKWPEYTALDSDNNLIFLKTSDVSRTFQDKSALIGTIYILNLSGSTFEWGTTALDTVGLTIIYNNTFASLGL